MSASTIRTPVRPGETALRKLAARRSRMLADRSTLAESLAPQRLADLQGCGVTDAEPLAELTSRCDALAGAATLIELEKTRSALEQAGEGGSLEGARAAVESLEELATRRWNSSTERELVLDEVVERTGVRFSEGSERWESDDRSTALAQLPGGRGAVPISLAASGEGDGAEATLLWHVARSNVRGDGTAGGDCDAQLRAVEAVAEEFGEGMRVEAEGAGAAAAEPPRHVTRRAH